MTYAVRILRAADRSLAKLPRDMQDRINTAIDTLADDPHPPNSKRLVNPDPIYRIRVGDYRVLYTVDDVAHQVTIVRVGHRREVYR